MDPRQLFVDERLTGFCVFCGGTSESRDHNPSKVFLDEPLPSNLPVVESCMKCNNSFSLDEQYLACLIECILCGSAEPDDITRPKVARILTENAALASRLRMSKQVDDTGNLTWEPDITRVRNVLYKLGRGHIAYELGLSREDEPEQVIILPFLAMSDEQCLEFESPDNGNMISWPEIGSRAFIHTTRNSENTLASEWIVVQPRRYRYLVNQSCGDTVQIVLSEYLACRIIWD